MKMSSLISCNQKKCKSESKKVDKEIKDLQKFYIWICYEKRKKKLKDVNSIGELNILTTKLIDLF